MEKYVAKSGASGIINSGGGKMNILPRCEEAVIPIEKFTEYALNPKRQPDKAIVFEKALGYNIANVDKLIANIKNNIQNFPAKSKGNKGHGELFEVVMILEGESGKKAKVLTGWIDDVNTGEVRFTSVYVDKK